MKSIERLLKIFLSLCCIVTPIHVFGATTDLQELQFRSLNINAVSNTEVSDLYQDSDGFIWIVTYGGLIRYDGYATSTYYLDGANGEDTFDGYLHKIIEDNNKCLIVGTERGLLRLDKRTGVFSKIKDAVMDNVNVSGIEKDDLGRIWFATDNGLYRKDANEDKFVKINLRSGNEDRILTDIIDLMIDSKGNMWLTSWDKGLYKYEIASGKLLSYSSGDLRQSYVLYEDSRNDIWVGTWGNGLLKLLPNLTDDSAMNYQKYSHNQFNDKSIIDDFIYDINEDASGNLWLACRNGLSILPETIQSSVVNFVNKVPGSEKSNLPYNEVNSILRTKDDVMWVGMLLGGICKAESETESIMTMDLESVREKYNANSVRSIFREDSTTFWLGIAGHGMIKYDRSDDSFVNYLDIPEFEHFLYTSTVDNIIKRSSTGEICFASYDHGLWLFNPDTRSTTVISTTTCHELTDDSIRALSEDTDGNIWIGTRQGAFILDKENKVSSLASYINYGAQNPAYKVLHFCTSQKGVVWMATNYDGIVKVDLVNKTIKSYTTTDSRPVRSFNSIMVDNNGIIWAASTWNGLYRYSKVSNDFEKVNEFALLDDKGITNLQTDPYGRIWVSTDKIVISFIVEEDGSYSSIAYHRLSDSGSPIFVNINASAYVLDMDAMAFGCSKGIRLFPCIINKDLSSKYDIVLTDLSINNVPYGHNTTYKGHKENLNYVKKLYLKHNDRNFSISFSLCDYNNPLRSIYRYRLTKENGNRKEVWKIVNGGGNEASFRDIKPGTYKFEVFGTGSGELVDSAGRQLMIHVAHNPWTSWWAVSSYFLFVVLILLFVLSSVKSKLALKRKAELDQMNIQKAEEINQAKLQFFTNISHEFLTPLSIILAAIESLKPKTEGEKSVVNIMTTNAIRLTRLVQQVLEFRKAESGNLKIRVSKGDAAEFIGHCVEAFIPLVRKHNLSISYTTNPDHIFGWFDMDKMDKIIYNLISNAVKYTSDGGIIKVSVSVEENNMLCVSCANNGKLIDKTKMSGLFKRFYEGSYREFNTIGTGIGLSLVKSLVTNHKGVINVESNDVVGNCFTFRIPIDEKAYSEEEIIKADDSETTMPLALSLNSDIIKSDKTILFVDDNSELSELFKCIMSKKFNVVTCSSSEEALKILDGGSIDVIVSDIAMPGMDGLELCSYVKEHVETSHIPVILLTAKKDDISNIEGYKRGIDGYITKPCNYSILSAMISNLIKKGERNSADFRRQVVFEVKDIDFTSTDKVFLQKAIDVVNQHISDSSFNLTEFVAEMSVSRTILIEKFKNLTGFTPASFILNARLIAAYKSVTEHKDKIRVSDLAYSVGFNDPKYFSKCFKERYGKSPKEIIETASDVKE